MKEKDNIKDSLQAKFQDFEVSPLENGWERIEMTLDKNRKIVTMRRRYISAAVAAVALLLIGSLLLMQTPQVLNDNNIMVQTSQDYPDESIDIEQKSVDNSDEVGSSNQSVSQKLFAGITKKSNKYRNNQRSVYMQSENTLDDKLVNIEKDTQAITVQENCSTKNSSEQEQITPAEAERRMQEFVAMAENGLVLEENIKESDKPVLLALSARGALTPFQTRVNTPVTLRNIPSKVPNAEGYYSANGMQPSKNIAEMEHVLPLSFGFTFSKNIIDRLSLETGLVYTYLFSKAKNRNELYNNVETQHFHYFGIPLQLNYNVFNLNKMNIYLSLGGMIEKDFRGEFRSIENNNESGDANSYVATKIEQKNPQYSMNVGLGVSYPIFDKFNLYGKIGGSYYFNANNAYKTIYSDKKTVLDLSLGVRYDIDIN